MTPAQRHLRHARLWLSGLFAAAVIVLGLIVGVTQLALPWIASHPEKISAMLSERLHRPVTIDRVDTHWERNGPLLNLTGVHLGVASADPASSNAQPVTIASAGIKINFFAWLRRNASWTEFRVAGVDLDLVRDVAGHWQLRGMDSSGGDERDVDDNALFGLGTLVLRDAHLSVNDLQNDRHTRFSADEMRLINKGDLHRVLARVKLMDTNSPPLDVVLEYDSHERTGRVYLGGQGLDIATMSRGYPVEGLLINRGKGRVQLWVSLAQGEVSEVRVEADLADLVLTTTSSIALDAAHDILPHIGLDRVAFGARWIRASDGWRADIADLAITRQDVEAPRGAVHLRKQTRAADSPSEYSVSLENLDASATASVAMLVDSLPVGLRRWLYAGNPEGTLGTASLRYVDGEDYDVAAKFDALAWHAYARLPSVSGFSGILLGDQDALSIDLPRHNAVAVSVPHVFRQALEFSELAGSIAIYRDGAAWRVETDALQFEGATPDKSYDGELRGAVDVGDDGSRPSLDVYALIAHADVRASHLFWPVNIMPPGAVSWLDRALDGGQVIGGRAVLRGSLADWPFRNNAGRFEAVAEVADFRLKYLGDWPAVEHGHALTDFVNTGLHVDVDAGSVQGNKVNKASVDITDYGEGTLDVSLNGQGAGRDLLGFIKATSLGTRFADPLQGVDIGGRGKVDFNLHAPMKPIESFTLDGTAQLADADLTDTKYDMHFDNSAGPVRFNRSGFSADALATVFHGKPAKFSLAAGGYVGDAQHVVEAKLDTHLPARDVLAYAPTLNDYQKYISGEADWNATFSVDHDAQNNSGQRLTLASDLRGVTIDMPSPLKKSPETALPLKLVLTLPFIGADLDLRLGDILHMHGRLPTPIAPFAAVVQFGNEAAATATGSSLPKAGMVIGGAAHTVDLSGWMDIATSASSSGDSNLIERVDLRATDLLAWDRTFGAAEVKLTSSADAVDLTFDGTNVAGILTIPRKDLRQRGVTADLKRLYWLDTPDSDSAVSTADANLATSPLNPATIPPLHIRIGDFRLGKATYGQASVESVPTADGMHFDQATTHSKSIDMRAHGEWTKRNGYHRSTFAIDLSAQDLGHMLDALGSAGLVDGGKTVSHIDASWAGPPSAFAIRQINGGALKLNIAEGRVPDIDIGAGRIAGLLNLAALPRRLSFDFGDLFNKGYSFDSIDGVFTMTDGYAYTEGLDVKSPSADMRIKGAMGLKTRDWDMVVEVTPHVGGTLLIGGALIGGPVGAAAGAVLQGVFKNQINAVTRADYKVTGSWDKPTIVKIGSTVVKNPAPNLDTKKSDSIKPDSSIKPDPSKPDPSKPDPSKPDAGNPQPQPSVH